MSYKEPKSYEDIIKYIAASLHRVNSGELSIADGTSNIVGATLANNSIEISNLYASHSGLEELVELCADTEIHNDAVKMISDPHLSADISTLWNDVNTCFRRLSAGMTH